MGNPSIRTLAGIGKGDTMTKPFGFKDKLGYLMGDIGNDFTFVLSSTFLLKFYTDVMGVSAAVVGTIMMIARFVDAFTDVTMGRICDKSPVTKAGKFKPWILRMCGPVAISSFLIYQTLVLGSLSLQGPAFFSWSQPWVVCLLAYAI